MTWQAVEAILLLVVGDTWMEVVRFFAIVLSGILTNFLIASYYAGKYKERVDRLTAEVNRYEDKVEEMGKKIQEQEIKFLNQQMATFKELAGYGRMIAAITGKANGTTFRAEGG